ncbi:MAG: hypothetical protein A3G18_05100 [Rhodospirillales bacterium RIFCSPLOWO2_12_FULL_58_28]|nr:MAG: hypothetical protein A3H92_05195 [Rhodospirillales bacterium RIFCSPLOWO2_02_FULL_58_16]OHC78287.1 MAG: hypothetical protein A3G18_05100 [Rhodospirillales bacterium RIFCSPLOWO2_12_FULL_58_28]
MSAHNIVSCSAPEAIAALHGYCFNDAWDARAISQILAMPGAFAFVGGGGAGPQGFILCRAAGGECEVITIGVAAKWRRRGLAGSLLDAALAAAAKMGAGQIFLEVAEDNEPARRFYQTKGFTEVGRRRNYYKRKSGTFVDALVLRYEIIPVAVKNDSKKSSPFLRGS